VKNLVKITQVLSLIGFLSLSLYFTLGNLYKKTENSNIQKMRMRISLNCAKLPIHCAIKNHSVAKFKKYLNSEDIIEARNEEGLSPLFWTIQGLELGPKSLPKVMDREKQVYFLEQLIQAGANVNTKDNNGMSLLYYAVFKEDLVAVEKLISAGVNLNSLSQKMNALNGSDSGEPQETPLHLSVVKNSFNITKLLLSSGANPNLPEASFNRTPLFISAFNKNEEITQLLIQFGADKNIRDKKGFTALEFVTLYKDHSKAIVELLK